MSTQDAVDTLLEVHKDKVAASMPCRTKGMKVQGAVDPLGTLQPEVSNMSISSSVLPLNVRWGS